MMNTIMLINFPFKEIEAIHHVRCGDYADLLLTLFFQRIPRLPLKRSYNKAQQDLQAMIKHHNIYPWNQ